MVEYDPGIIQEFANELYRKARNLCFFYAFIFGAVGGIALGLFVGTVWMAITGRIMAGALGYFYGLQKGFLLKLQAQTALCQVRIEENTRQET